MRLFIIIVLFFSSFKSLAASDTSGGFYLSQTRVIYVSDKKQATITATNSEKDKTWLLRSWIEQYDEKNSGVVPFIVTPPLYRLDGGSSIQLRINGVDLEHLPKDRESIFRLNVMTIPPEKDNKISHDSEASGNIKFAMNNRIKVFYRPMELDISEQKNKAYQKIIFENQNGKITISNPTPYFITLTQLKINNTKFTDNSLDLMLHPYNKLYLPLQQNTVKTLSYRAITDHGGITPEVVVNI